MSSEEREPEQMGSHFGHLDELPLQGPTLIARFFPAEAGRSREPFIVAIEDRAMRIWGIPGPQQLVPQEGGLEFVRFEPTGRRLWCVSDEKLVAWSFGAEGVGSRDEGVEQPREIRDAVAEGMGPQFCGIAFDPGRAILACARGDHPRGRVPGWVFVLPDELQGARSFPCSSEPSWVALSPDRTQLAVAEGNGGVELWTYDSELRELTERVALPALGVGAPRLSCVRYLGTRFLLGSAGSHLSAGGILRWDLDDLVAPPVPVAPHGIRRALRCLAVSHDNRLVATGGDDQMVRVMRVIRQGGRPKLDPAWLEDHGAGVYAVAFAARDGELLLASADGHGAVRLWDAETGAQRGHLRDPSNRDAGIFGLDFSPDGRHLAASLRDGRVLLWDMDRPRRCLEGNRDCAAELLRLQAGSR